MISYWKNWWFHFVVGIINFFVCFHFIATDQDILGVAWLVSGLYWIGSSVVMNNRDNIKKLHERITTLENRAVTDIDKVSENNYMVRRRLGPDKDVPYPEEETKDGNQV
jgi:hypothetical protein